MKKHPCLMLDNDTIDRIIAFFENGLDIVCRTLAERAFAVYLHNLHDGRKPDSDIEKYEPGIGLWLVKADGSVMLKMNRPEQGYIKRSMAANEILKLVLINEEAFGATFVFENVLLSLIEGQAWCTLQTEISCCYWLARFFRRHVKDRATTADTPVGENKVQIEEAML